ncbi:polysaccharide pyruvyl transferase family protein [Novosphingobium sp. 9U]|uniref:polysaccharide pyruvyl transferase family protein n=1 Tax=Novosphingobium sp. 9U TaxID=2653158 RepID=UPI0012F233F9|nr:polysaccharide pyruvyl transferase family protein [Novosphingobium sp. 9U]VWX54708.1 Polysaccharide pyruvyl transferase family protein [Novosphingobium sp. 9U]
MFRELDDESSPGGSGKPLKIGVLTFHRCINYGSYWQARSLVEGLAARGHDVVLLDYADPQTDRIEWRCAMQPLLPRRSSREDVRSYGRKTRAFQQAIAELPVSNPFPLREPAAMEPRDLVVIGSDEVWNLTHPWYGGYELFWGGGIPARRVVSYAASFGNYDADAGIDGRWTNRLRRLDAISVRDDNSRRLVSTALDREPALVLDPVLQFPIARPSRVEPAGEPFVAVYGHSFSAGFGDAVRRWAEPRGLKLVSIGYRNDWADEQRLDVDPLEFARMIAQSSAVVTNFFHGCVFALLNEKPFACAITPYRMNKVRDLTRALGAEAHLLREDDPPERFAAVLDAPLDPAITAAIVRMRAASEEYLQSVLA